MTERADFLVNNRSPRYLHGFQKDTNETTELPHTVPVDNQVTYIDSFTNYGVDTVYGKEYVLAASEGNDPRIQDALNLATHVELTSKKYHGIFWDDETSSYETTISYNVSTRTLTIAPTAGSFRVYIDGAIHVYYGPQTITHAATEGGWFFYYNSSGVLTASQTAWSLLADVPVAYLYYDATTPDYILLEERHHHESDKEWHNSQHFAMGTFVKRGTDFVLGNYTIGVSSDAAVTWSLGSGTVVDEDINTAITAVADGGPYQTWRKDGASGVWRRTQRTIPYHFNAGTNWIQYNQLTGGSWTLTDLSNNQFVCYYIFVVPSTETSKQVIVLPGQRVHTSESSADFEGLSDLDLTGFPSQEFVATWKLVLRADTGGLATGRAQIRTVTRLTGVRAATYIGGSSPTVHNALSGRSDVDTHPATSISNTPAGNISATTVQAAINELDSEKAQLAAALTNQRVPFANASGFLTDNANFYYVAGTGLRVTDTTTASSKTTGAIVVTGGIGAGGVFSSSYLQNETSSFSGVDLIPNSYIYTLNNGSVSGVFYGNQFISFLTGSTVLSSSAMYVHYTRPYMQSSGAVRDIAAYVSDPYFFTGASGTVTELCGFRANSGFYGGTASSAITNFKQICVSNPFSNNVTNKYGLWIDSIAGATNNWAIYVTGGLTYLGGRLHINDSTSATSTTTGAMTVEGGIGTKGALWVGNGGNMAGTNAIFGNAGTDRQFIFKTGSSTRWRFQCNGAAESGSNAGSDFDFVAHDDSGVTIDVPLSIVRAAGGLMTLARPSKFTGNVGFNNTTPISKPTVTGSRGGNAALASLLTALANYGLITDSTTA